MGVSIRKIVRGGRTRWEVVADLGPDPATGKRRQRSKTCDTEREAKRLRTQWETDLAQGTAVERSKQTVAEMMAYWLETYAITRKVRTQVDYRWEIQHHVLPYLGAMKVQTLEPRHITTWHTDLRKAGKSPRAIRQAHLRLSQALEQALTHGVVPRNVAKIIKPPKQVENPERPTWTTEQARAFVATAQGHCTYGPIFRLSLVTGMRRGELLGLRWSDIDWKAKVLRLRQSVGPIHNKMTAGTTKNRHSDRDVDVTDALLDDLREHRRRQNEQRLKAGASWHDLDLVFASEVGTAIQAPNLYREYRRLEELASAPHIAIHDQRHTVASWAVAAGIDPKTAAERLGHDPRVLLGIYTHSNKHLRRQAAQTLESALSGDQVTGEEQDAR
jgi:integrase